MLLVELGAVVRGTDAVLGRLPTSSVSNSSSPKLLDVVLLDGECGCLLYTSDAADE